jgi:hypothetical protein
MEELELYVKRRVTSLCLYNAEGPRGGPFTGTFLASGDRRFVLTAAHCFDQVPNGREVGEALVMQASLRFADDEGNDVAIERYKDVFIQPRAEDIAIEDGVESRYEFQDLALFEIGAEYVQLAESNRAFVAREKFGIVKTYDAVLLTGYRSRDVDADGNLQALHVRPFTYETVIKAVSQRLIQLEYDPESHPELANEPFGISGSGVYNAAGAFCGMVWGGDMERKRLWVCPAHLIEQFLIRHFTRGGSGFLNSKSPRYK